jgi:hypothetical protein
MASAASCSACSAWRSAFLMSYSVRRSSASARIAAKCASMTPTGLRVVLAEDDVLLREGLASLLDGSVFEVRGQAATVRNCSRWSATRLRTWW